MDQDTTIDPYESHGDDRVDVEGRDSISMPRLSTLRILWGAVLAVLSIVGNMTVPWLIEGLLPTLNRTLFRSYGFNLQFEFFLVSWAIGAGLVIAQCVAVWLVCNAYLPSRSGRLLIGSFVNLLVITTWIVGVTISVGRKPPIGTAILLLGGGTMVYLLVGWILGTLLKQTRSGWRQNASKSNSQYSLRTLLVVMIAVAVIALIGKWIPDNQRGFTWIPLSEITSIILFLACLALGISCLVWLQYKALRGDHKVFSWAMFISYLVLGPFAFLCVSGLVIEWGKSWQAIFTVEVIMLSYCIPLGIVFGIALVMPLLPRSV
ncbi:MAG: hypothetical protein ACK480_01265 [Planctomycetota bacterium]|jgi:hypothetical protein